MGSKITLIVGVLGILLGGAVALFFIILVPMTNGRTSFEEALPGIIGGCACSFISLIIAVVGLVFVMKSRKMIASSTTTPPTPPIP